jgi:hypothetical protein
MLFNFCSLQKCCKITSHSAYDARSTEINGVKNNSQPEMLNSFADFLMFVLLKEMAVLRSFLAKCIPKFHSQKLG